MALKIGIIINGYYQPANLIRQIERLRNYLSKGAEVRIYDTAEILTYIGSNGLTLNIDVDAAVYLDKDTDIAKMLEYGGVKVFNSPEAIRISDNKLITHIELARCGIRQPITIGSPLRYRGDDTFDLKKTAEMLGFPMIVKECHGSFGSQVYLAETFDKLIEIRKKLIDKPHIYQQYIETAKGRDIRVIVIGDKVVASMERVNSNDFRSNIEQGGNGLKIDSLDESITETAIKVCKIIGLDYAGIDIISDNGEPLICEVNSNAYFNKITEVTGVDIAANYSEYILERLN